MWSRVEYSFRLIFDHYVKYECRERFDAIFAHGTILIRTNVKRRILYIFRKVSTAFRYNFNPFPLRSSPSPFT